MSNLAKRTTAMTSVLLAILILASGITILAQAASIATITGRVTDPSGAVVSGAQVKITASATNTVTTAVTGADGSIQFPESSNRRVYA